MLVDLAEALADSGRQAVLYNFPYSDLGRRAPDPPDVLERTARAVGDYARGGPGAAKVVLGGKSFARWDLIEALLERLSPLASLHRIDDGDHSFGVPKRSGRTPAEVQKEVFDAILRWLEAHGL
jgi:hypothetical protein